MSRRLNRVWPLLVCLLASEVWALGLGDIRLNSALNEPLRAEIELLSATPEDLESLKIDLASADTFERYGIDRPVYLTRIRFDIERRGGGTVVRVQSQQAITEPFLTFLVEANWARGRLLREYTVLLDPPTFAPPPAEETTEAVAAPRRSTQTDSGRIERPAPRPAPQPAADRESFDTAAGGDYQVRRGDTLWRIAERVRPDDRLTMNQTMIAIYESNPDAFAGNINVLRADSRLRIPSADQIFRISRGEALTRVQREYDAWSGAAPAERRPSLTLVAPDADQDAYRGGAAAGADATQAGDAATTDRIRRLEEQVAEQESLLEIRDNELAQLRAELERLREERAQAADTAPPDAAPEVADEEPVTDSDEIFVDDTPTVDQEPQVDAADEEPAAETQPEPAPRVVSPQREEEGLLDTIIGALTGIWGFIGLALIAIIGVLVWFARRASSGDDTDSTGVWDALDADDLDSESVATTERLRALARDDDTSIVVVEQGSGAVSAEDTVETPAARDTDTGTFESPSLQETGEPVSLEDTFSSETAINLDQSDPIAEADFHMAYGLYDQAADLINGALAVEPDRTDLLAKLCEVYFVWGNRDAFVEAAERYRNAAGDGGDWDKIVIMGQQIATDSPMFAEGSRTAGATRSVDLAFDEGSGDAALDMDFASDDDAGAGDVIDLGAGDDDGLDFAFDEEQPDTSESITQEMPGKDSDATVESPTVETEAADEPTQESPTIETEAADDTTESPTLETEAAEDPTTESPTIERPFDDVDSTSELPSMTDDDLTEQFGRDGSDATAEIELDDLGLDLGSLADDFDSDDDILSDLEDTGRREAADDSAADTGRNEELRPEDTDVRTDVDVSVDDDLRDATGETQVLPEDFELDTGNRKVDLSDDDATMLAPGPGSDDPDFDFAATEALPKDSFESDPSTAETGEMPGPAGSTDMDLDLDDLTAALKISEDGDTVDQPRDDATVEQPSLGSDEDLDFDLGMGEGSSDDPTQALSPDDVSDDLQDARTMTEVGTKLDLARAYVDMGDPGGARNILEEVLDEGDESQRQQAQQLLDTLPG